MRQRRIKNIEEKLLTYTDLIIENPEERKGAWRNCFIPKKDSNDDIIDSESNGSSGAMIPSDSQNDIPLFLEIGCGKGRFITESAKADKKSFFLAVEGVPSVVYRALDRVTKEELDNVRFITQYVNDANEWFEKEEVDGIFLNFSDPWPKARTAKRRLTYREKLNQYHDVLKPGGFIRIKTDNDDFFAFTLEEIEAVNSACKTSVEEPNSEQLNQKELAPIYEIVALTRDLHKSEWADIGPMTEYEKKFTNLRKNINFVELRKV